MADPSEMLLYTPWVKKALPMHALVPIILYGALRSQSMGKAFVPFMSVLSFGNPLMVKLLGSRLWQLVCLTSGGSGVTEQRTMPLVIVWSALKHSTARQRLMGLQKLVIFCAAQVVRVRTLIKATATAALRLLVSVSLLNQFSSLGCIPEVVGLGCTLAPC